MEFQHVSFGYRRNKPVLQDVTFQLQQGITILLGENGSGKTTLIKNMLGLLTPNAGNILGAREGVRYLPQDYSLYPSLQVRDVLRFVAEMTGTPKKEINAAIGLAAEKANITDALKKRFGACSIGTQKRVGIAATLLGKPELAVLDEPTAGVDPKERMAFYGVVREAFDGTSVLLSTHILDDLESLADQVLMLSKGKLVFDGSYKEYRSLLDRRLWEVAGTEKPEWLRGYRVVSVHRKEGKQCWRFVAEDTPPDGELVSASTEDIWTFLTEGTL